MSTHLEHLDDTLFQPIGATAACVVGGQANPRFSYIGESWLDGNIYRDYEVDPDEELAA